MEKRKAQGLDDIPVTTDAIFCLGMLMEKWSEGQKAVHCVFIDLEKAYHRIPREEMWEC